LNSDTTDILTIRNLSFSYGSQTIFDDVSIRVRRGDMIGVIGPNGSGKSTLLHLINGLRRPVKGVIRLENSVVDRMRPRDIARSIAFVPQQTVVAHDFSALDIVLMGRFPYKSMVAFENADDLQIAMEMLEMTGAASLKKRRFHSLSGGEQQRVVMASALAQEPSLILLDEPTSDLDVYYQMHIFNTLKMFNQTRGLTVICAIHDINLAALFCNRIWLLGDAHGICDGPPGEIIDPRRIGAIFNVRLQSIRTAEGNRWLVPDLSGTGTP